MTMNNPKQINKAVYFVDERNHWCQVCWDRLMDQPAEESERLIDCDQVDCTECVAFAAGTHPELPKKKRPTHQVITNPIELTEDEQEALLKAISVLVQEIGSYLEDGNIRVDYGTEAREICTMNVSRYQLLGGLCERWGDEQLATECRALSREWEEKRDDQTE